MTNDKTQDAGVATNSTPAAGSACPCAHDAQRRDGWKYCRNCHLQFYQKPNDNHERQEPRNET